jgi:hypothetical protein
MPTSDTGILLCKGLIVCRLLINALLVSDTHILQSISAVMSSSLILWGHSVTHYFGHPSDPLTKICSCSQKILSS